MPHGLLEWVHDIPEWNRMVAEWVVGNSPLPMLWIAFGAFVLTFLINRSIGPGWLPHDPCPFCCWCLGDEPFGARIERRVWARLTGGEA